MRRRNRLKIEDKIMVIRMLVEVVVVRIVELRDEIKLWQ